MTGSDAPRKRNNSVVATTMATITNVANHDSENNANNNSNSAISRSNTRNEDLLSPNPITRRLTRQSIPTSIPSESDSNSDDSASSTDTEEDVWFPMDENHRSRRGIDFDELQQFIDEQRLENRGLIRPPASAAHKDNSQVRRKNKSRLSKAAAKYVPHWVHKKSRIKLSDDIAMDDFGPLEEETKDSSGSTLPIQVGFDPSQNKVEDNNSSGSSNNDSGRSFVVPNRFSLFTSASEATIHAPDLSSLVQPGESIKDLFAGEEDPNFTWWLDCSCPSDNEVKIIAKSFGIHPLTTEDIRMQEHREKVEFFKDYYFVTFHSFDSDSESEEFLEPLLFYMVVFRQGILTFHSSPVVHCINVRRRIRQLKEYIPLSSDWICYALIDNITDFFFPVIDAVDYETDAIEASAFVIRDSNFSTMLFQIGESRRKVMTLIRLLSGKTDVLKMLHKRCAEDQDSVEIPENRTRSNLAALNNAILAATPTPDGSSSNLVTVKQRSSLASPDGEVIKPRREIALFLGDIQDHIITLNMNLSSYEKILSRAYTNYLAQLQVESFNSNNRVTEIMSKFTIISVVWLPLNMATGLFGMNVKVPGQEADTLAWWFGILGVLILISIVGVIFTNWWIRKVRLSEEEEEPAADNRTFITRFLSRRKNLRQDIENNASRSVVSFAN